MRRLLAGDRGDPDRRERLDDHARSRLLGVVVTMLPTKGPDSYGYGEYTYGVSHELEAAEGFRGNA